MKRLIQPGTDACVFCRSTPTNKEHVFSAWSHRYLTKEPGKWRGAVGEETLDGKENLRPVKGRGAIYDWQVKCVCEKKCNNGWMNEVEKKAKPILVPLIQGKQTKLTKADQRIIAGWACIKAIVGEYESPHLASWNTADRSRLMRFKLPPAKDCMVILGRFQRTALPMHWLNLPMNFLWGVENRHRLGELATEFNSAATTQVIGQLFIHVLHAPKLTRILKKVDLRPQVGRKLVVVWPPQNTIEWPPEALNDADADYVANLVFRQISGKARALLAQKTGA